MHAIEIQVRAPLSHTNRSTRFWVTFQVRQITNGRFLKFDPSKIKYMAVRALPLRPDLAKVGVEIRVVGFVIAIN